MQYLTKANRSRFLACAAIIRIGKAWADDELGQLTAEEKKWLRLSTTYIKKCCTSILTRVGKDFADRLTREAKNSEMIIEPIRLSRDNSKYVSEEVIYTIADYALVICQHNNYCPSGGKDHTHCGLYKALIEADVPVSSLDTDGCPYKL